MSRNTTGRPFHLGPWSVVRAPENWRFPWKILRGEKLIGYWPTKREAVAEVERRVRLKGRAY